VVWKIPAVFQFINLSRNIWWQTWKWKHSFTIFSLDTRQRKIISFTLRSLHRRGKASPVSIEQKDT